MHMNHSIHLSSQNMNCSTGVALYKAIKCCQSEVDVKAFSAKKKCRIFSFGVIMPS